MKIKYISLSCHYLYYDVNMRLNNVQLVKSFLCDNYLFLHFFKLHFKFTEKYSPLCYLLRWELIFSFLMMFA